MAEVKWNPWHGCRKLSPGCQHCYVYRIDARYERDATEVHRNKNAFSLPLAQDRWGNYKYPSDTVFNTCFTSDFFLEDADGWREEIWQIMRMRRDCRFFLITKRIHRFTDCIPSDWGDGYENVTIAVTCENQKMADYRLPIYLSLPIRNKLIVCEPLLECIDLSPYLCEEIRTVSVGGESGNEARLCRFDWVLAMRKQCMDAGVPFHFRQTGANFEKNGKCYWIPKAKQMEQAARANVDYRPVREE